MTFGNYIRLSYWWRSIDSLITLIVFELEENWITLNLIKEIEFALVEFASGQKCERSKAWTFESVNGRNCSGWSYIGWNGVGRNDM